MGSKYPILPPEDIITALKQAGYCKVSQKGSHSKYRKDGRLSQPGIESVVYYRYNSNGFKIM